MLGDTSQILITMFIVYNLPSFHLAYILIYYCLAPTLFRVVASTHSLYLIITGTPLPILAHCYLLSLLRLLLSFRDYISSCLQVALTVRGVSWLAPLSNTTSELSSALKYTKCLPSK